MKKIKWKSMLAIIISLTMLPAFPAVVQAYPANSVLDLRFEDNLTDGAGNTVTVSSGAASYVEGVDGQGQAISLTSNSQHLSLGTNARLNPTTGLTASFWFKPNGTMSGEQIFIWTKGDYNTAGWYISSANNNAPLVLSVGVGSGGSGSGQPYEVNVTGATRASFFPANQWTHIAVTFDPNGREAKIFRNGVAQPIVIGNSGSAGTITDTGSTKYIGRNGTHNNTLMNGSLDDFLVFDAPMSHNAILDVYEEKREFDPTDLLNADAAAISLPSRTNMDLTLPSLGTNGSVITWASSNTTMISNEGVVSLPDNGEVNVTITATFEFWGKTITKDYVVTLFSTEFEPVVLEDVGTDNVTIIDPYLLNAESKDIELLLSLEPMRFLAHFYTTAGLTRPSIGTIMDPITNTLVSPSGASPYDDLNGENTWERSTGNNFRGHMFGHYMSAMAMAYETTDDANIKARLLARIKECVVELQKCQAATYSNSVNDGYIGPFGDVRLDNMDGLSVGTGTSSGTVYVPWYNLHKVYIGLVDIYKCVKDATLDTPITHQGTSFNNLGELSLDIVSRYGDYFYDTRVTRYTQTNKNNLLNIEYGGMNDMFYELYKITRSPKHKAAAECFDENTLFDSLAAGNDVLPGKHANTQVPKFVGALNRYTTLTQDDEFYDALTSTEKTQLESRYYPAVENFFDIVLDGHSYITGGQSQGEHFRQPNSMAATIQSNDTHETCNEYNMLKIARGMFKITQDKKYADYYENVFVNAILSSQNPETGHMTYFQQMGSGYNKLFGFNRFWCCVGTGVENFVKLDDSIYFTNEDRVYVNLYFSSVLNYAERNLKLAQESNLYFSDRSKPFSDTVKFTVDGINSDTEVGKVDLYFRQPDWCVSDPVVKVNGQTVTTLLLSGGYIVVNDVSAGDEIELTFPMEASLDALEDNTNVVAFRYGPLVLSAGLGTRNMSATNDNGILVLVPQRDTSAPSMIVIANGQDAEEWKEDIANNFVRVEDAPNGEPQFRLNGTNLDDTLLYTPHYQRYNERYGLYMTLIDAPNSTVVQDLIYNKKFAARESEDTPTYLAQFDDHAYEGGYSLEQSGTTIGEWNGRTFRQSIANNTSDAYFSYELPVVSDAKNYLNTVLARADKGRSWSIYINDVLFATETVTDDVSIGTTLDSKFYATTREIPEKYTSGSGLLIKQVDGEDVPYVKVEFRRTSGWLGRLFGVSITQREELFDNNPNLSGLEFEGGTLTPAFDPEIKEYVLTPDEEVTSVKMLATPHKVNGIVTVGGVIIDDTQPQTISVPQYLKLETYSQNHLSSTTYTIVIGNAEDPGESPDQDPKVWYKMDSLDGTAISDSSGYGQGNATAAGSPSITTQDGITGLDLNGSSKHVVLPRTIFKDVPDDFTISTMVYFRSGNTWSRIFDFGPGSSSNIMFLTANTLQFSMDNANALIPTTEDNNTSNANRWRMITITHGDGVTTMYIDGKAVASGIQSSTAPRNTTSGNYYLARSNWGSDPYPNLMLSDFRIYSRAMNALDTAVMYGKPQLTRTFESLSIGSTLYDGESLPRSLAGFPITWSSSEPDVLAADGYTIIGSETEQQVTFTAEITGIDGLVKTFEATVTDSEFYIDTTWNKVTLEPGQTLTVTTRYRNNMPAGHSLNAFSYLALYDGEGRLISVSNSELTVTSAGDVGSVSTNLQLPESLPEGASVKMFLWDDNYVPLIEAVSFVPNTP